MATLREYYETDFSSVANVARGIELQTPAGPLALSPRVHIDDNANATFVSCYVPLGQHTAAVCRFLVETVDVVLEANKGLQVITGVSGQDPEDRLDSSTLQYAGRFFFYCEEQLPAAFRREIKQFAKSRNVHVAFRGPDYATARAIWEKPMAFISHDSRDKDLIARPIAIGLTKRVCPVWYDEYSLRVGAPLRESIERGLRECKKCILVLTPNFLSNSGWTRTEFNAIFTREMIERTAVILPVWQDVTPKDVYEYSPTLADRVALNGKSGEEAVIRGLHTEIVRAG